MRPRRRKRKLSTIATYQRAPRKIAIVLEILRFDLIDHHTMLVLHSRHKAQLEIVYEFAC